MDVDEIYPGQIVRIIEWEYRPEHWSEDMDGWQGEVVTIGKIYDDEEIYIEDDSREWQWYPEDFEPYHMIPADNPNMRYKVHKHEARMRELRGVLKK